MNEPEKLRKAVEITIAAGYQLDQGAFGFLFTVASTTDPTEVVAKAIEKLESLDSKPPFIEKSFLEELLGDYTGDVKEIATPVQEPFGENPESEATQGTIGRMGFRPYAKEVDADINVIENPGVELSTSGAIGDFLAYFQDRF